MAEITKNNKKIGSAFNVATAEFIRDHKSLGQAVDDDITTELVTEFELDEFVSPFEVNKLFEPVLRVAAAFDIAALFKKLLDIISFLDNCKRFNAFRCVINSLLYNSSHRFNLYSIGN